MRCFRCKPGIGIGFRNRGRPGPPSPRHGVTGRVRPAPFLLRALPRSTVVPLLVGEADPAGIDVPLEAPWDGPESATAG